MEWIDLGCYRLQQIVIAQLPVTLAALEADRDDGIELPPPAPTAVHIGDQELGAGSQYPCVEIKARTSVRLQPDQSPDRYAHPLSIILTAIDTNAQRLELRIVRYGLALLQTLNGQGLQPEMAAELIAGNLFYTLLDRPWRNAPFVRSVALEALVTSVTTRSL